MPSYYLESVGIVETLVCWAGICQLATNYDVVSPSQGYMDALSLLVASSNIMSGLVL
jgi:hypothetical protein